MALMKYPDMVAESQATGMEVNLPEAAKGRITLVVLSRDRDQAGVDEWRKPFLSRFGDDLNFAFYEVMMATDVWTKASEDAYDSGLETGVPVPEHENALTYYGELDKYEAILGLDDPTINYAFLLDRRGFIQWVADGPATQDSINDLLETAGRLI